MITGFLVNKNQARLNVAIAEILPVACARVNTVTLIKWLIVNESFEDGEQIRPMALCNALSCRAAQNLGGEASHCGKGRFFTWLIGACIFDQDDKLGV